MNILAVPFIRFVRRGQAKAFWSPNKHAWDKATKQDFSSLVRIPNTEFEIQEPDIEYEVIIPRKYSGKGKVFVWTNRGHTFYYDFPSVPVCPVADEQGNLLRFIHYKGEGNVISVFDGEYIVKSILPQEVHSQILEWLDRNPQYLAKILSYKL